ncbi:MAG: PhzF family phenazine biosynthesis protein, partial [Desulfatirhabdiaceae bacterium]
TNVFQNGPNGGNPCPVVLDGDDLKTEHGKHLAATFGAETIIILNSKEPDSDFGLRFFVPKYEMEMCVHGTIAATTVLKKIGRISKTPVKIETALGQITVEWKDESGELMVTVYQFPPKFSDSNPTTDEVCSALRIPLSAITKDKGPIVSVSTSRSKLIVPIVSTDILDRLDPDFEMLWNLCDQYHTTGFYPFAKNDRGSPNSYSARQFPKRAGYNEDPATGVAACALGAYLTRYCSHDRGWHYFKVYQGNAMRKPSLLEVSACLEKEYITKTSVSGKAQVLSEESLTLYASKRG